MVGTCSGVDEGQGRLNSQKAFFRDYAYLREIFEKLLTGIILIDEEEHVIVEANSRAAEMIGCDRNLIVGKVCHGFICPAEHGKCPISDLGQTVDNARKVLITWSGEQIPVLKTVSRISIGGKPHLLDCFVDLTEQVGIMDELRESQEKLKAITSSARDGIIKIDNQGDINFWNPAAEAMFGYTEGEVLGRNLHELIAPQRYHEAHGKGFAAFRETGQGPAISRTLELQALHRDGHEFPVELSLSSIHIKGEWNAIAIVRDITERKNKDAVLREALAELNTIHENIPMAIMLVDRDRRVRKVNSGAAALAGKTPDEMAGLRGGEALGCLNSLDDPQGCGFGPECRKCAIRETVQETFKTGIGVRNAEHWLPLGTGGRTSKTCLQFSTALLDTGGEKSVLVCAQDITPMKKSMMDLRGSEEKHRALVEGLPDIVMRFDRQGRHLYASKNVTEITGLAADAFIGKTHRDLGMPDDMCRFWEEAIEQVFETGQPYETEFTFSGTGGEVIFNWRLIPEYGIDGNVASVLSISRDITAQRRAEQDYRTLFTEMLEGFALHEIILDEHGTPSDYRFLAVNPAFERMTGLKAGDILSKRVLEVIPAIESSWIERYGRVAMTGEPAHFDSFSKGLGRHYEVTAFRPSPGKFATIFYDITEKMETNRRLNEHVADLERYRKATIEREHRMIELKEELRKSKSGVRDTGTA